MSELFHQFGVNWQLLLAQMVNFAILLFVLKKFAYGPLLSILRERRTRIAEGLKAAEASQKRLAEADAEKDAILTAARKESLGIVQEGERRGKTSEQHIVESAQQQAIGIIDEGKMRAAEEKLKMTEEVRRESAVFLKTALAKIVERSPETLDQKLVDDVVHELKKV